MILYAFTLLDTKTGIHSPPFFMAHSGQAVRAVMDLASDPQTQVGRHPADFSLIRVGTFDDQAGVLAHEPFQHFGTALSFIDARPTTRGLFEKE